MARIQVGEELVQQVDGHRGVGGRKPVIGRCAAVGLGERPPIPQVVMRIDDGQLRQQRIPQHATVAILHDVERRADHALVLGQSIGPGRWNVGPVESGDHPKFAVDGVSRGQQFPGRLAAQHIVPAGAVRQPISRVGLATAELLRPHRLDVAIDMGCHEPAERFFVETVLLLHLHRADVICAFTCQSVPLNGHSFAGSLLARYSVRNID